MCVTAEATNGIEALKLIKEKDFDIAVLDINMPNKSGLEVIDSLNSQRKKIPILILSGHSEEQYATKVIKKGAAGYMTKETAPDELVNAIRKIYSGGRYVSPAVATMIFEEINNGKLNNIEPHLNLSGREKEIFIMLANGKTITEIAKKLKISVKTVSTYRQRIMSKMNTKSNVELTKYAYEKKMI